MSQGLPPSADFMNPPTGGRCKMCGQLIGSEPARIVAYPDAVHDRCRDRYYQNFPFGEDLAKLRRMAKSLALAYRLVVEDGKWLAASAISWPDAREDISKKWPERKANARVRLEALLSSMRRF